MILDQWAGILGMNRRNWHIDRENALDAIRLANDKVATKAALQAAGVPVVPTITLVRDRQDLAAIDWQALPDAWVAKPNRGRRGVGVLLVAGRDGSGWRTASGRHLDQEEVTDQIREILEGEQSADLSGQDAALLEPLIVPHPALAGSVLFGLPDIRVICYHDEPLMAMLRLPTRASNGRANLHQGGIGAGVDLVSGKVIRAVIQGQPITHHPDTNELLIGVEVPEWDRIINAASRCSAATGLVYVGADVVVDRDRGTLMMEVNARPGLEIQNVTGSGLADRLSGARADGD